MVTVHQAEIEGTVVARYECEACHLARDAAVETYGLGKKVLGSRKDSEEEAERDAVERAEDTLMFVPCPSCGHRQSGRREVVAKTVSLYATIALGGTVASGVALQLKGFEDDELLWMTLGIGGFLVVFCAGALLAWSRHPWVRAVQRTRFLDDEGVVLSQGTRERRRQEQVEAATLRRRLLMALGIALAGGAVVAVVQMLERGGEGLRAVATPAVSAAPSSSAAVPKLPLDEQLTHPMRHQLEIEGRRVDVFDGRVDVARHASEHLRIPKLWSHVGDDVSFVYDPSLTVIERGRDLVIYGDEGMAKIRSFDDPPEDVEAFDEEPRETTEAVTVTIGEGDREGWRRKGWRGDRLDRFLFELDRSATVEVHVRRTQPSTPALDRALSSLTTRPKARRARYVAIVGERIELFEGEREVLGSGLEATLRPRATVWRLVGGLRLEHPADVVVMSRPHPTEGQEVIAERGGVELVLARRPEVPSAAEALAWLSPASREGASAIEGAPIDGLRVVSGDEVLEAYGLQGRAGGLAVLVRRGADASEQATRLLQSVAMPLVRR